MLRDHFKEVQFSKEQYAYFNGRLKLNSDGYNVNFPICHKTMTKQHKLKKLAFRFLLTDIYDRYEPSTYYQDEIQQDYHKSLAEIFEDHYCKKEVDTGPVEVELTDVEEDVPIQGNPRFEKRTNIYDIVTKPKEVKPKVLGLRTL